MPAGEVVSGAPTQRTTEAEGMPKLQSLRVPGTVADFVQSHTRGLQFHWPGQNSLTFWDVWVARDVNGRRFVNDAPYLQHSPSADRLMSGHPFQAYCCWNGMVKLRAAPFKSGLRFRAQYNCECRASECTLLCDDFHRMGYWRVVVDPSVVVTYTVELRTKLYHNTSLRPVSSSWRQVAEQPHWLQNAKPPQYGAVECCDLKPGEKFVIWHRDCHMVDVMRPNYTSPEGRPEYCPIPPRSLLLPALGTALLLALLLLVLSPRVRHTVFAHLRRTGLWRDGYANVWPGGAWPAGGVTYHVFVSSGVYGGENGKVSARVPFIGKGLSDVLQPLSSSQ